MTNTPIQSATVSYICQDGFHIDSLDALANELDALALSLEEEAEVLKGKDKAALLRAVEGIRGFTPDAEALPPEPDPIAEAQLLLWEERQRAQELLRTESARQRREAMSKEAFCMPTELLNGVILALRPELRGEGFENEYNAVKAVLDGYGWKTEFTDNSAYIAKRYEPLRQLSALIERHPQSNLTSKTLEVLHYALRWCENTSLNYLSPISGKANGNAPEGVLYPHVSMELHAFESRREIPKEWHGPLVEVEQDHAINE